MKLLLIIYYNPRKFGNLDFYKHDKRDNARQSTVYLGYISLTKCYMNDKLQMQHNIIDEYDTIAI